MDKITATNRNFEKNHAVNSGLNIEYYDHTRKEILYSLTLKARQIYVLPILFYQKFISPVIMPSCRFTPSCSEYTRHSILKYGIFWGTLYGAWRIFRCSPFFKGGYDPVD
ncbi:MAG: membrane protein insertion efficiency factor YidD [Candidatus Wallbacteria bacterium]